MEPLVTHINLKGFEEFDHYTNDMDGDNKPVFFYFSGTKQADGDSWCPDCVVAEPIVKKFAEDFSRYNFNLVYVDVGDRVAWKDIHCPFRTDYRCKLMVIPTIIRWKGVQRLEGSQCADVELLQLLFDDD